MYDIGHNQARRLIRAAMDDRGLPDDQWAALHAHLEGCVACRTYQRDLRGMEHGLRREMRQRWSQAVSPGEGRLVEQAVRWSARRRRAAGFWERITHSGARLAGWALIIAIAALVIRSILTPQTGEQVAQNPTSAAPEIIQTPTFDFGPNGFQGAVAYASDREGNSEIYLLNFFSGRIDAAENLTHHPAQDSDPAWSPDGEWLAFLSDRTGKTEVFVMHVSGSRLTQLTDDPGVDWSGPLSWSNDGAWIGVIGRPAAVAGIMDRRDPSLAAIAGGNRAFASAYAASDGADAMNDEKNGHAPGVYLVPVNYENVYGEDRPVRLGYSLGARWQAFSSSFPMLAYETEPWPRPFTILDTHNGQRVQVERDETGALPEVSGLNGLVDWSEDGRSLAYLAVGTGPGEPYPVEAGLEIRVFGNLTTELESYARTRVADRLALGTEVRALAWGPADAAILTVEGGPPRGGPQGGQKVGAVDCWRLTLRSTQVDNPAAEGMGGLCVTGGVDPGGADRVHETAAEGGSATPDVAGTAAGYAAPREPDDPGGPDGPIDVYWLAVTGFTAEGEGGKPDSTPGIYLVRIDHDHCCVNGIYFNGFARLGDAEGIRGNPVLRPGGRRLGIIPMAARAPEPDLPPSELPGDLGRLLAVSGQGSTLQVLSLRPDGKDRRVFNRAPMNMSCPAWSPDGQRLAFVVSDEGESRRQQLYLLEEDRVTRMTGDNLALNPPGGDVGTESSWECPAWSDDGSVIASMLRTRLGETYLALLPAGEGNAGDAEVYIPVKHLGQMLNSPVWLPSGNGVILMSVIDGEPALLNVTLSDYPGEAMQWRIQELLRAPDWNYLLDMDVAVDILPLLYMTLSFGPDGRRMADVRLLPRDGVEGGAERILLSLPEAIEPIYSSNSVRWLPDGRIGLLVQRDAHRKVKFEARILDPAAGQVTVATRSEYVVSAAAWSPDGRYLAWSDEAGLWVQDLAAGEAGTAGPAWVGDIEARALAWR